ncbi:MAG: FeoB-associated Cys-rich membrane protein [Oscillibacter sp.]|nr:FeoB-associated Cys-rich membrane protein [Oscillibacter sp.]
MPPILGNLIVILTLTAVVALALRSMWRSHKSAAHCTGDCSTCHSCHTKKETPPSS